MKTTIKVGKLSDFFASARETARKIDAGQKVTARKTVWVEPNAFFLSSDGDELLEDKKAHGE